MKTEFIIKRKLETAILPYTVSGETLSQSLDWKLYHGYAYTKEILPILSGFGISPAILASLGPSAPDATSLASLGTLGIGAFLLLTFLKIRAGREELTKKILGQKKIIRQLKALEFRMGTALDKDNSEAVLNDLIEIQKEIITIWNNGIQEDHLDGSPSQDAVNKAFEKSKKLLQTYRKEEWSNIDNSEVDNLPDQK